jgi:glycosyl transferase-like sugar-binding protein
MVADLIPKIILQTWKTVDLPRPFAAWHAQMKELNPGFEVRLFSDDESAAFVRKNYPDFVDAWTALRTPVERADLFRILAVHHFGGFYFDLDVVMCRPLEPLLKFPCIFPFEKMLDPYTAANYGLYEQLGQYAFGARPQHPLLLRYAENIREVALHPELGPPQTAVERFPSPDEIVRIILSTGPGMLARTLGLNPELGTDLHVLSARPRGDKKRLLYCFGPFGSHAMLGGFGWKQGRGQLELVKAPLRYLAWQRLLRHARRTATIVGAAEMELESWAKPQPWVRTRETA